MSTTTRHLRVIEKTALAEGVVGVRLADPDAEPVPAWSPGAHLDLVLDPSTTRQYSLCGDPGNSAELMIAVLREGAGRGGSIHVHDKLEVGALVEVGGPRNNFELVDAPAYLFVAGGIGITPILPMLRAAQARGTSWSLLYGGRTRASMAFADQLVAEFGERVHIRPQDQTGHLDLAAALGAAAAGTGVYCCGPTPLLDAIERQSQDHPALRLHIERFTAKEIVADGPDTAFEVELASSGQVVPVGADETLLDALLGAGLPMEFSCREGTCGTCEVAVLGGEPDHRDSVLDSDEQAANDAMMVCVSRSRCPRLVLDL